MTPKTRLTQAFQDLSLLRMDNLSSDVWFLAHKTLCLNLGIRAPQTQARDNIIAQMRQKRWETLP